MEVCVPSPIAPHILVAEIQLLRFGVVADEKAALDGVQVHLKEEKAGHHVS